MAFGRDDTDALYDQIIAPTLRSMKVKPVRIDRVEHNDDIDDRIVQGLLEADFVLADLTYARPSVYFEAGFAQRNVPVIYTVRKDHFQSKTDDPYGNFRVHFDLQMKNIIGWGGQQDAGFRKRLKARLNIVIRPLLARRKSQQRDDTRLRDFEALPRKDKAAKAIQAARRALRGLGFRTSLVTAESQQTLFPIPTYWRNPWNLYEGAASGRRAAAGAVDVVFVQVFDSITKPLIRAFHRQLLELQPDEFVTKFGKAQWSVAEHYVVCSFGPCSISKLHSYLPAFRRDGNSLRWDDESSSRSVYVYLVDGARRLIGIGSEVRSLIGPVPT
jgi:nucleoside 2-deoxyribosyltransferase